MSVLEELPTVNSFFGIDLRTGALIIGAISIIHPVAYGCTLFIPMSYIFLTIWILVALYFAASIALICGLVNEDQTFCTVWTWYTLVFVCLMMLLMILLAVAFTTRQQTGRVIAVILGILYYVLTIYFIIVVNSHCQKLPKK